jgi:hypothetical protein
VNIFKFIGKAFIWLTRRASAIDKWRKLIPMSDLIDFIAQAEAFNEMDGFAKRAYVSKRITAWAKSRGFAIPESVVNYLIEEALQIFLKQTRKEPHSP